MIIFWTHQWWALLAYSSVGACFFLRYARIYFSNAQRRARRYGGASCARATWHVLGAICSGFAAFYFWPLFVGFFALAFVGRRVAALSKRAIYLLLPAYFEQRREIELEESQRRTEQARRATEEAMREIEGATPDHVPPVSTDATTIGFTHRTTATAEAPHRPAWDYSKHKRAWSSTTTPVGIVPLSYAEFFERAIPLHRYCDRDHCFYVCRQGDSAMAHDPACTCEACNPANKPQQPKGGGKRR